jgi:hypothetical protein
VHNLSSYLDLFLNPLQAMASRFAGFLPRAAAALILLIVGLILARAVLTVLEDVGAKLHIDDLTSRIGINEVLTRLGLGKSPCSLAGTVAYWCILLAFVFQAGQALELTVVSGILDRFLSFLGSLVVAIVMLFGGLAFARALGGVVERAAAANNIGGGSALARWVSIAVIAFTSLLALEELGMQFAMTLDTVKIAIGAVGLAFAIAFGLGGKDLAAEVLHSLRKADKP